MIKYEVVKDSRIEIVHHGAIPHYTTQELLEYADNRSAYYYDTLASSENKEEAQKIFEAEKNYCRTQKFVGYGSVMGIEFDVLKLVEAEYYEDGELYQTLDILDFYIEPMTK
jgi:hypothetical protein